MSIFREHKTIADRSARDRKRHKQKIEKAIKEGIHDIVAEESIIGKDGKKKIKIPVAHPETLSILILDLGHWSLGSCYCLPLAPWFLALSWVIRRYFVDSSD